MRRTAKTEVATTRTPSAALAAVVTLALMVAPAHAAELSFLYALSDANGPVPTSWVRLAHDAEANETFVVDPAEGIVRVFNRAGMETYSFGDDETLGTVVDLGVLDGGDLVVLSYRSGRLALLRCDFRGGLRGRIELQGVPAELASLVPDRLRVVSGTIYLASSLAMRVVAVSAEGAFVRAYDASGVIGVGGRKGGDAGFTGFGVDASGNVLFTVAPMFQAFVLAPDGQLRAFGTRGSSPGKFNVVGGIAADEAGNLYVTDVLRSVVMVFDSSFEFRGEFGYRGYGPGNLIAPRDLVVGDGQVFVTQSAGRGVSVFRIEAPRVEARSPSPS
jgi:outer membrane protein assembly factor BamB